MDWWDLPGPSGYVAEAVQAIRDGSNLILALPDHVPDGLGQRLRREVGSDWVWDDWPDEAGRNPLDVLLDRCPAPPTGEPSRGLRDLAERADLRHRIWFIQTSCPARWAAWQSVIEAYRSACHGSGLPGHAQFLVLLLGDSAAEAPDPDTLLAVRRWDGVVGSLDMLLYTASRLRDIRLDHLAREATISTVAALALWDPVVVDRFAWEPDIEAALEQPGQLLRTLAQERDWDPTGDDAWETGRLDRRDGLPYVHSAILASRGDLAEINRRRWRGQVSVIFPYLDDRRRDLIEAASRHLTVPYDSDVGGGRRRRHLYELELTDIINQLRNSSAPRDAIDVARALRDLRNSLAHFDAVRKDAYSQPFINQIQRLQSRR